MKVHHYLKTLFLLISTTYLWGQSTLPTRFSCHWENDKIKPTIPFAEPSKEAQDIIKRMTAAVGLEPNFTLKSAPIKTVLATTEGGQRSILYGTSFLENIQRDTQIYWARMK